MQHKILEYMCPCMIYKTRLPCAFTYNESDSGICSSTTQNEPHNFYHAAELNSRSMCLPVNHRLPSCSHSNNPIIYTPNAFNSGYNLPRRSSIQLCCCTLTFHSRSNSFRPRRRILTRSTLIFTLCSRGSLPFRCPLPCRRTRW